MKECYNIRDYVLDELQYGRTPTTFFLLNGFQLKGVLLHYDDEVLIIDSGCFHHCPIFTAGISQRILKHNIKDFKK